MLTRVGGWRVLARADPPHGLAAMGFDATSGGALRVPDGGERSEADLPAPGWVRDLLAAVRERSR